MITLTDTQTTIALLAAVSNVMIALTGLITSIKSVKQSNRNGAAIQKVHDCMDENHIAMTTAVTVAAEAAKEASITTAIVLKEAKNG